MPPLLLLAVPDLLEACNRESGTGTRCDGAIDQVATNGRKNSRPGNLRNFQKINFHLRNATFHNLITEIHSYLFPYLSHYLPINYKEIFSWEAFVKDFLKLMYVKFTY